MPTSFDEVIDLGLISIDDYKLNKLYMNDMEAFYNFCDGLLIRAIPNFTDCKQSLDYTVDYDATPPIRTFHNELTIYEKDILGDYWVLEWFKRETQVASRINAALQNSGSFRTHSEAANLKAKETYLNSLRVKIAQKCIDYVTMDVSSLGING